MAAPVLPLYLTDAGINVAVLGWFGVGAIVASIPGGRAIAKLGESPVLLGSLALISLCLAAIGFTQALLPIALLQLGAGSGAVIGRLAIQTFVTRSVDPLIRARAMSFVGGTRRVGFFVGPPIGGLLADAYGFRTAIICAGAVTSMGFVPALSATRMNPSTRPARSQSSLTQAFGRHWKLLLISATGPLFVMAARTGRDVLVPLFGDDVGLSPTQVGFLFAVGTGSDLILFPIAGYVMDRFGRLFAIVPAFGLLALGLFAIGLATSVTDVVVATMIMGLGNGLSAGTMLTLGSDLAPIDDTSDFLAGFAAIQGFGQVSGPVIVGIAAERVGLNFAAFVLCAVMVTGITWLVFVVGETRNRSVA
jgi:MFS family permease